MRLTSVNFNVFKGEYLEGLKISSHIQYWVVS
ncbi:MAG: hypothetical protein ACI8PW_000514 [Methylophilaceae bacterium]|jgi:hypothetical protein